MKKLKETLAGSIIIITIYYYCYSATATATINTAKWIEKMEIIVSDKLGQKSYTSDFG